MAAYTLSSLFILFSYTILSGQEVQETSLSPENSIDFEFIKLDVELPKAGSYFNVVRVKNNSGENFIGKLTITVPSNWNVIGKSDQDLDLAPSEELLVPIRISMPPSVLGGVSYMINAEIKGEDYFDYTTSYVSIVQISRWDIDLDMSNIYISDFQPQGDFSLYVNNRGNSNELIKLAFTTGGLLEFVNPLEGDSLMFVEMPAYSDSVLQFKIRERSDLSYAERQALVNNWRSSSIYLVASTTDAKRYEGLRVLPLESSSINSLPLENSPLSLDMTLNNLLSYQPPKFTARAGGRILFPESQQLQYLVGLANVYFNPEMNQNFDLYQQLRFMVRYNDKNTNVWLDNRMGAGELHTLSGQGFRAEHTLADKHTIQLNGVNNIYSKSVGVFAGYSTTIKNITINTGVTVETYTNSRNGYYSYHLGAGYRFRRNHNVKAQVITSLNNFISNSYVENDTSTVGFAYRLSYQYKTKKFKFRIDNTNTKSSYLRNSGMNRINGRSELLIDDRNRIEAVYFRYSHDANRYPYSFVFPSSRNINDNGHIYYSRNQGKIIYRIGPQIRNSVRTFYNPADGFSTTYKNFQPAIIGSATYRLGMLRSITPYVSLSSMFVNYTSDEPGFDPYELNRFLSYTVGLSYYDQAFKFNAYFTGGESSDIYRSVVVEDDPSINKAFNVRPYYERYFNDRNIRLSGYLNFAYYLPSGRENTLLNLTSDFHMKGGWKTYISFNLFRNVRTDDETGRISTQDMNLMVGVRKSFDIQQPRLKYYDLTILGFNDLNGNGLRDSNEKPISNVLINLSRDANRNLKKVSGFSEIDLITDPNGEIYYENIPEGIYDLDITSLSNLENLYFLNGENQSIEVGADMIHYLPLVETYKVKGKLIMVRDPNSNEGLVSLEGVRVTAVSEDGGTYSTLTNGYGGYTLSLPRAAVYEVSMYNVYGERFTLEQGRYKVQFTDNKTVNLDFKFTEKRREVQFNEGEELFDFNIRREE